MPLGRRGVFVVVSTSSSSLLLIRADADSQVGIGHVMRSFALAEAWREIGGEARFVGTIPDPLAKRLETSEIERLDAAGPRGSAADLERLLELAEKSDPAWIVLDGYQFFGSYQQDLGRSPWRFVAVDDHGHPDVRADVIVNGNLYAETSMYPGRSEESLLLLGPRYLLMRSEFREAREKIATFAPPPDRVRRLLVIFGGSDRAGMTRRVVAALRLLDPAVQMEVRIVLGPAESRPTKPDLPGELQEGLSITRLHQPHMPELMRWAELAVSAAGSTSYELALLGVPSILIPIADNQRPVAEALAARGAAVNLGWHEEITVTYLSEAIRSLLESRDARAELIRNLCGLVDGEGAPRVARCLSGGCVELREALPEDVRQIWEWANDPAVRETSFSPRPIPWEDHVRWFENRLRRSDSRIYVAVTPEGDGVGQIRFDLEEEETVLTISVAASSRGGGYGPWIIRRGCAKLRRETGIDTFVALIRPENSASIRAFEKAGFRARETVEIDKWEARRFVLRLPRRHH